MGEIARQNWGHKTCHLTSEDFEEVFFYLFMPKKHKRRKKSKFKFKKILEVNLQKDQRKN